MLLMQLLFDDTSQMMLMQDEGSGRGMPGRVHRPCFIEGFFEVPRIASRGVQVLR